MKTVTFVSIFVIRPAAAGWEFLQIFRAPGRYMEGTWQLVAGGIEPGEAAWQSAIREMREETSLVPEELYHLGVHSFYLPHNDTLNHAIDFCAVVSKDAAVVLNEEHLEFRWIPADQIESMLTWPTQRAGSRHVISEIINNGLSKPHCRVAIP